MISRVENTITAVELMRSNIGTTKKDDDDEDDDEGKELVNEGSGTINILHTGYVVSMPNDAPAAHLYSESGEYDQSSDNRCRISFVF